MDLLTVAHPDEPALDMALTQALLDAVARGGGGKAIRVFRPGATLAFGRLDRLRPGFAQACRVAVAHGYEPLVRLAGGRAVAYDPDCVLVELVRPQPRIVGGLEERFAELAGLLHDALKAEQIEVEMGERPGEYCPGRYSLHLPGGPKIAGIAQRVVLGASLTTAVLVVRGGEALRATIVDVYAGLDLDVDGKSAGALSDHHPGVSAADIAQRICALVATRHGAVVADPDPEVLNRARALMPTQRPN